MMILNNTMKVSFLLLFSIFLVKCNDKLDESSVNRIILNESGKNVAVFIYSDTLFNTEIAAFDIKDGDSIIFPGKCFSGVENYCDVGWFDEDAQASRILFEKEKVAEEILKNPLTTNKIIFSMRIGTGYSQSIQNGIETFSFEITQEDYDNAADIEG